jgi:hypothetical protein
MTEAPDSTGMRTVREGSIAVSLIAHSFLNKLDKSIQKAGSHAVASRSPFAGAARESSHIPTPQ